MKLDSVSKINEKIEEVESQIETLKDLRGDLIHKRNAMERTFGSGGECPECGDVEAKRKRGIGRGYTIECQNCGFKVYGSD